MIPVVCLVSEGLDYIHLTLTACSVVPIVRRGGSRTALRIWRRLLAFEEGDHGVDERLGLLLHAGGSGAGDDYRLAAGDAGAHLLFAAKLGARLAVDQ